MVSKGNAPTNRSLSTALLTYNGGYVSIAHRTHLHSLACEREIYNFATTIQTNPPSPPNNPPHIFQDVRKHPPINPNLQHPPPTQKSPPLTHIRPRRTTRSPIRKPRSRHQNPHRSHICSRPGTSRDRRQCPRFKRRCRFRRIPCLQGESQARV